MTAPSEEPELIPAVAPLAAPATAGGSLPLLQVRNLVKHFPITRGIVFKRALGTIRACDGIPGAVASGAATGCEFCRGRVRVCRGAGGEPALWLARSGFCR